MPLLAPRAAILREPLPESPARNGPTADSACFRLTGGLGDKSPAFRYLRTVGSLTLSLRAIDAIDSPFILRRRIDWTLGMPVITFPDLLDGKRSTIKIRPTGGRHAFCLNPKKLHD